MPFQTISAKMPFQTVNTEIPFQTFNAEIPFQTFNAEVSFTPSYLGLQVLHIITLFSYKMCNKTGNWSTKVHVIFIKTL